jgi:NAD(P)H-hydrate epimerase
MTDEELAALLVETGDKHHQAYSASDGVDPEWALWYAGYLQARIWDGLGALLPRSVIVYAMIGGDREASGSDDPSNWPVVYARLHSHLATD